MVLLISWKNVWRNKARSFVIISAVTVGLFGGIFSYALMMGGTLQRIDSAIKYETACLQLHNPAFLLENDLQNNIKNPQLYTEYIQKMPQVTGLADRLKSTAMISTAYASAGIVINGIHPEKEKKVTRLFEAVKQGNFLKNTDQIPILIGKKLATKLNADIGDKLILSAPTANGDVAYGAFILKGIYDTQNDMFDGVQVYIKKSDLASLVGVPESTTSELAVNLTNSDLSTSITNQLNKTFASEVKGKKIAIQSWKELDPTLSVMIETMDFFSWIFVGIILLALAFGIVNTMLMVVMERVREIGMLMSVGMNKFRIFTMIMWETIFLSFVGGIAGITISALFISYLHKYGLNLSAVAQGMNSFGFSSVIYPSAPLSFYIEVAVMVFVTAILASIYPALKALKLNPAEAVRS